MGIGGGRRPEGAEGIFSDASAPPSHAPGCKALGESSADSSPKA